MKNRIRNSMFDLIENARLPALNSEGKVGGPILLYFLGVPGGICLLLWLFFFRG